MAQPKPAEVLDYKKLAEKRKRIVDAV